jgi:hypothetical protein
MEGTAKYFDEGQEPQIRIISADPKMWYADKLGKIFHATSYDAQDGGWYSIKEFPSKSIKAGDVEFGEEIGKADITEAVKEQEKREAEKKKEELKEVTEKTQIDTPPPVNVSNQVRELIDKQKTKQNSEPKFIKPRMEWDWDTELLVTDLFVTFTDDKGHTYKGLVDKVDKSTVTMRDKSGMTHSISIADYMEGKIKVDFPEL